MKIKNLLILAIALLVSPVLFANHLGESSEKEAKNSDAVLTKEMQQSITPELALKKLMNGNKRFVEGKSSRYNYVNDVHQTADGQYPMAMVLSCVDSRTSSEIIFDQPLGNIFNARIAGNFVNTDILGSMEFACKVAGAKLILVVGHSKCGAVKGACDHVELGNLTNVMNEIKPAVEAVKNFPGENTSKNDAFVAEVTKQNVLLAIREIREKSSILKEMEEKGEIKIVGAMYDLKTGITDFNLQ